MFEVLKILDGGLGSTLEMKGYDVASSPLFSAYLLQKNPEAIIEVHSDFIKAGADIIITASYQASIDGFKNHLSLSREETLGLIKKSVSLAKEACVSCNRDDILVAGSVGPYGACQSDGSEYTGDYIHRITDQELKDWHVPRIEALLSSGVHLLAIETIPSLKEALVLLQLLKSYPEARCWISFSCKDGQRTCFGDEYDKAVEECYNENRQQLKAIGVNCTDPSYVSSLLQRADKVVPGHILPKVVYPNSGEIWTKDKRWEGDSNLFTSYLKSEYPKWLELGTKIIGGCCRVTPSHIDNLSEFIKTSEK